MPNNSWMKKPASAHELKDQGVFRLATTPTSADGPKQFASAPNRG